MQVPLAESRHVCALTRIRAGSQGESGSLVMLGAVMEPCGRRQNLGLEWEGSQPLASARLLVARASQPSAKVRPVEFGTVRGVKGCRVSADLGLAHLARTRVRAHDPRLAAGETQRTGLLIAFIAAASPSMPHGDVKS